MYVKKNDYFPLTKVLSGIVVDFDLPHVPKLENEKVEFCKNKINTFHYFYII